MPSDKIVGYSISRKGGYVKDVGGDNKGKSQHAHEQQKKIAGFERLWVWQNSFALMNEIHTMCRGLPREEKFKLRDQIERSSASVCDNIAEGYCAYYYKEKTKGFLTARKEAGETQNHIRKLSGKKYISEEHGQALVECYEEIIRGINGYVSYIRRKSKSRR